MPEGLGYGSAPPVPSGANMAPKQPAGQFGPFMAHLQATFSQMSPQEKQIVRSLAIHPQAGPVLEKLLSPEGARMIQMARNGAMPPKAPIQPVPPPAPPVPPGAIQGG